MSRIRNAALFVTCIAFVSGCSLVLDATSPPQPGPSFCGLRFGLDVHQQLPRCPWPQSTANNRQTCLEETLSTYSNSCAIFFYDDTCRSLGNGFGIVSQESNRLAEIVLGFRSWQFSEVSATVEAKCGPPTVSTTDPDSERDGKLSALQLYRCDGLFIRIDEWCVTRACDIDRVGPSAEYMSSSGIVHISTPEHAHTVEGETWKLLEGR